MKDQGFITEKAAEAMVISVIIFGVFCFAMGVGVGILIDYKRFLGG